MYGFVLGLGCCWIDVLLLCGFVDLPLGFDRGSTCWLTCLLEWAMGLF